MKKVALLIGALSTVVSMMFVRIPTTHAGENYNGTDPAATGCAKDARTVWLVIDGPVGKDVKLELRYSPTCRTAWARLTLPQPASGTDYQQSFGVAHITRDQDGLVYACQVPVGKTSCYTKQVNDAGYTSYAEADVFVDGKGYFPRTPSY